MTEQRAFDMAEFARQQASIAKAAAAKPGTIAYEVTHILAGKPPFICKFCGAPSWIAPSDQEPPPDYCHKSDHGCQADYEDCYDEPE